MFNLVLPTFQKQSFVFIPVREYVAFTRWFIVGINHDLCTHIHCAQCYLVSHRIQMSKDAGLGGAHDVISLRLISSFLTNWWTLKEHIHTHTAQVHVFTKTSLHFLFLWHKWIRHVINVFRIWQNLIHLQRNTQKHVVGIYKFNWAFSFRICYIKCYYKLNIQRCLSQWRPLN